MPLPLPSPTHLKAHVKNSFVFDTENNSTELRIYSKSACVNTFLALAIVLPAPSNISAARAQSAKA